MNLDDFKVSSSTFGTPDLFKLGSEYQTPGISLFFVSRVENNALHIGADAPDCLEHGRKLIA
eukprot:CAMPEP_0204637190 /NCGR_PEP_ID=MMETSP0717-20131115/35829_1 /ASSEMBLY_ACC=CAM_ASM_000666 /TAXON_ID=230516 /ORGANISM="Chaetoceros curvisetus" /LENGTH=61 /DNA_ID=CAMNT_0051656501 /DNA_START=86 /DNA_END=267 /DNA_ORIENTATION=-